MFHIARVKEFKKFTDFNLELPSLKPWSNMYERRASV